MLGRRTYISVAGLRFPALRSDFIVSCGPWLQSHNRLQADRVFGDRLTSMTADDAAWPSRCQVKKKANICLQYY